MRDLKNQKGQALLIILLVMAVGLTMGLAVVSRSVTDIRISHQEEESARVFSAAEAGIEKALLENLAVGTPLTGRVGEINYSVSSVEEGGSPKYDFGGGKFLSGDTQTVWLIDHTPGGEIGTNTFPANGTIAVCWGEGATPAIEVAITYELGGSFKVVRGGYDPVLVRRNENKFDSPGSVDFAKCGDLDFEKDINLVGFGIPGGAKLYILRLTLLYNETIAQPLRVWGSASFPSQGKCYVSTATVESGVTRKVKQCQTYKAPPAIFDYVLFSGGDLEK